MKHSLGLFILAALGLSASMTSAADQSSAALLQQGREVAIAADCSACHTAPGGRSFAGGYKIASPMGDIISSNITPSKTAGIGNYTEEDFARAVRKGVLPDGTHLYPAMPYTSYKGMTDRDIAALYAYIMQQVPAVDEPATAVTQLSFPFNIRAMMAGWNLMYARGSWQPPKGLTEQQARGAYLVDVLAHCGACHTPRGVMMNEDNSAYLTGGTVGGWSAPDITNDPLHGIGHWSDADLVSYLREGLAEGKGSAAGPMGEAVEHSFSKMPLDDLQAMVAYLRTVQYKGTAAAQSSPAMQSGKQARAGDITRYEPGFDYTAKNLADYQGVTSGAQLYSSACASCHGENGQGVKGAFPSLTSNATVNASDPSNLIMVIYDGINRHDSRGYTVMPGFKRDLDDQQIAALASYVTQRFGHPDVSVTSEQVAVTRSGGPTPWLVSNIYFLVVGGGVAALLIIAVLARFWRRKKQHKQEKIA